MDLLLPPVVRRHGDDVGSIAFGEFPRARDTLAAVVGRRGSSSMMVLRYVGPVDEVLAKIAQGHDRVWPAARWREGRAATACGRDGPSGTMRRAQRS